MPASEVNAPPTLKAPTQSCILCWLHTFFIPATHSIAQQVPGALAYEARGQALSIKLPADPSRDSVGSYWMKNGLFLPFTAQK